MVVGYHGCDAATGRKILAGDEMLLSEKTYDWLGKGVYFWENDPKRAQEWADEKKARGDYDEPFVIGALIDLGNCLDLTLRDNHEFLKVAYQGYYEDAKKGGKEILQNKDLAVDKQADKLLRFLDCAVINYLHTMLGAHPEWRPRPHVHRMQTSRRQSDPASDPASARDAPGICEGR